MENDLYDIKEILPIFEPYVKRLEVDELLPHVELVVGAEKSRLFPIQKNCVADTDTETVSRLFDTFNVSLLWEKVSFIPSIPKNCSIWPQMVCISLYRDFESNKD